ncbi:MAG TPA: HNH endonuclease [Gemmatimonadaceae bacterium]|nr:HNH endonuclease [Gemmatimonadaceae bacterium]
MPSTPDLLLREAAFARLRQLRDSKDGVTIVSAAEIAEGFVFEGERIRLGPTQQGIWKPQQLGAYGAALTIVTVAPKPGRPAPYDDQLDENTGFFTYKYEGTDPNNPRNRAVRRAYETRAPMIYLIGVQPGLYDAVFPVFITGDSPSQLEFRVEKDVDLRLIGAAHVDVALRAPDREYATRAVKVRLHQRRFRDLIMRAYRTRCAICQLRHADLLDAAHILSDRHERGLPEIPNGLALCKIHHSAYDLDIIGIDPDYRVHVNGDVLKERDGPMLQHGLQQMHGADLITPKAESQKPNRDFLAERFERWRAA